MSFLMAGFERGQDETNPVFWLATRAAGWGARRAYLAFPGLPSLSRKSRFCFGHIMNPLLTKLVLFYCICSNFLFNFLFFKQPHYFTIDYYLEMGHYQDYNKLYTVNKEQKCTHHNVVVFVHLNPIFFKKCIC